MNDKLNCSIVRDLLPSYVDNLTSAETNAAVEQHLSDCADCSETFRAMKNPEDKKTTPAVEVDYLKKVRRHTRSSSILIGIFLMLLGMSIIGFRSFYVGSQAAASDTVCDVSVSGNTVTVSGTVVAGGKSVSRISFSDSNGMVQMKIYTVPKAFFNSKTFSETYTAQSEVVQVRADDLIVWEEGVEIGRMASQLFAATNPFVGDMPSNSEVASILGISDQFGPLTNSLQTAQEPYGWTLELENGIDEDELNTAQNLMAADSYVMLACIENLGYVTWSYTVDGKAQKYTVTADDATAFAGQNIKLCGETATEMQKLVSSLSITWEGVRESLQETGRFIIAFVNNTNEKIYGFTVNYYLGNKKIGSSTGVNADESLIKRNDSMEFEFQPEMFPDGTTAIELSNFSFDLIVICENGEEFIAAENVKLNAKYAWSFFYNLQGNSTQGFVLNAG